MALHSLHRSSGRVSGSVRQCLQSDSRSAHMSTAIGGGLLVPGTVNVPRYLAPLGARQLHRCEGNPVGIVARQVERFFHDRWPSPFPCERNLPGHVGTATNFETLLIPDGHWTRSHEHTYFADDETILRRQTSAHQQEMLRAGHRRALFSGECYRRDEIDRTHHAVFHQLDGLEVWPDEDAGTHGPLDEEPQRVLGALFEHLFPGTAYRFLPEEDFPASDPVFELQAAVPDGGWLELLAGGVMHPKTLEMAGYHGHHGWSFGIGLDRIAMLKFGIDDIRQLWSTHPKFLQQYADGKGRTFVPYCPPHEARRGMVVFERPARSDRPLHEHDVFDVVRAVGGDAVAEARVEEHDDGRMLHVEYQHVDRELADDEMEAVHAQIARVLEDALGVRVRAAELHQLQTV